MARTKNSVLENKAVKAPNPYAKNPDMDAAMMLAEMSSGSSGSSSDDEIPESAKRRETKIDMEDEDYTPEKEYPAQGALARAIQESKEKKKKESSDDFSSPLGVKCHVSYCWCSVQPGKNHCGLPGHEHRLNTFGDRLCSIPGCNESTFNLQTEKCNLHLESRRVPRASEKKSVAPVVKQQQKTLDPTDFSSYTVKNDIVYSDRIQIRVLENKETKDLLYHSPAIATIWYKPCVRHNRAEKFAASSSIVQCLNDTGDDYLCIEGGGLKGGRTAYLTQEGLKKTLQKRKADDKLYILFGLPVPPKEESKSEDDKKEEKQKKKKRKRQEVEHVIQCGHHGCLRSVPTSLDTLCSFHQAEADEHKQEEEARNTKNTLMLQGVMLDNDTTLEPPAQEEDSSPPPPTKKLKTKEKKGESKKSVRWQCLNCNKEAVEGMAHCSDHIPSPDLSDTAPQMISSVEPLALPKPAVTFAAAAMAILTKSAMESSSSSTVPIEDDDKNMSSGPGVVVVIQPPPKQEEPSFICADIARRRDRMPFHNGATCLKEFKDTGRCEFHYNKLTGRFIVMGSQAPRVWCHYPKCKLSPPSSDINFCGSEAHKIRPDNQGARYCKMPACHSLLSSDPSEFYCILHKQGPTRPRASKARVIQEDTICVWDGKCQEVIADPNSLLCGKHHQESKARQEAVNKAKQENKQRSPMMIDLAPITQAPDQQQQPEETKQEKQQQPLMITLAPITQETKQAPEQPPVMVDLTQESEVDKLKAENEALQRQLKLNTSVAFMCNKTDMLKSLLRQAEYLKTLYLPAEQHKEILSHLDAVHNLVKDYAGRRV